MRTAAAAPVLALAGAALACAHGAAGKSSDPSDPPIEDVIERAKSQSKPVVLFFHADW